MITAKFFNIVCAETDIVCKLFIDVKSMATKSRVSGSHRRVTVHEKSGKDINPMYLANDTSKNAAQFWQNNKLFGNGKLNVYMSSLFSKIMDTLHELYVITESADSKKRL